MSYLKISLEKTFLFFVVILLLTSCASKNKNFIKPNFLIERPIIADVNYHFPSLAVRHKGGMVPIAMMAYYAHLREVKTKKILNAASQGAFDVQRKYNEDILSYIDDVEWVDVSNKNKIKDEKQMVERFYDDASERYQLYILSLPVVYDNNVFYNYIDFSLYDKKALGYEGRVRRLDKYKPVMRFRVSEKYKIPGSSVFDGVKQEGEWIDEKGGLIEKAMKETTSKAIKKFLFYLNNPNLIQ